MTPDLLIVGGGVVGLSLADFALEAGLTVTVVDQGPMARESSWAGAGMLTCRPRANSPKGADYYDLALLANKMYPAWAERLKSQSGIDPGYRVSGAIELVLSGSNSEPSGEVEPGLPLPRTRESLLALTESCQSRGVRARIVSRQEIAALEPAVGSNIEFGVEFPDEAQIRPPWLARALTASIERRGGVLRPETPVADVNLSGGSAVGVVLRNGERLEAGRMAICAGAWSGQFPALTRVAPRVQKVEPVRGSILCYQLPAPRADLAQRMLTSERHYLVPRGDGVILVGATHEHAGFVKETTREGLEELENFAQKILPALKETRPAQSWAGLRPGLKGRHPLFGPVAGVENLYVCTGHYRNGFLLAPATAQLLVQTVLARKTEIPVKLWSLTEVSTK